MKLFFLSFALIASAFAQSNELVLCDQQATSHCLTWFIGNNLPADYTLSGPSANGAGGLANNGSGALSWVPYLPLAGGTMTGLLRMSGGYGNSIVASLGSNYEADSDPTWLQSTTNCTFPPAFNGGTTYALGDIARQSGTTYTSLSNGNLNHTPPNGTWWTPACVDDRTRIDWIGMEGVFFRIKGKGTNTIGDYYDWTRFSAASSALPLHQVNFNDSSFNTLIHIDSAAYPLGSFEFTGVVQTTIGAATGQVSADQTKMDYFGFEGNFFRIKATGASCGGGPCGDYFDWTRWTSGTSALPQHQLNLNDSSFNTILHIDSIAYPLGIFEFTGTLQTKTFAAGQTSADQTKMDYFGFEGNFVRVKGTGTTCGGGPCGDYFDWTRWTSDPNIALPQHQLNLNDSSFNTLIHIDESGGLAQTTYDFTGNVRASSTMQAPLYRVNNGSDYFDFLNTGLGTHAWDLRDSLAFAIETYRNTTGSSATGTFTFNGNVTITGTCSGCTGSGGAVTSIIGTANEVLISPPGGTGAVTLSLPQAIATTSIPTFGGLLVNTTNSGHGYNLQTASLEVAAAGNILVNSTAANALNVPSGGITVGSLGVAGNAGQFNAQGSNLSGFYAYRRTMGVLASNPGDVWAFYNPDGTARLWTSTTGDLYSFTITGHFTAAGDVDTSSGLYRIANVAAIRKNTGTLQWSNDGVAWNSFGTGGSGVSSITGTTNEIAVSPPGTGAVTLSLPQEIATSSVPIFGGLLLNQALNDGSGYTLQVTGGIEAKGAGINILSQGTGNNAFNASAGGITATTGYWIGGTQVINASGQWVGTALVTSVSAGTAISITGTASVPIINNTGVTSITAGLGVGITPAGTGNVTLSIGQSVATNAVVQFGSLLVNQVNDSSGNLVQINGGLEITSGSTAISARNTSGVNSSAMEMFENGTVSALSATATGTGAFHDMTFSTHNAERLRITQDNKLLWNLTSSDLSAGTIVAANSINVATGTANASVVGMFAIAGVRAGLASSVSGAGTFLPMAFDTNNAERMRILTSGNVLFNRTTDDGSGSVIQANGFINASSGYKSNGLTVINSSGQWVGTSIVTSLSAGSGISLNATTGTVTVTNAGVTSLSNGGNITVSGSTGGISISIPQSVATSSAVTFGGLTVNGGITANGAAGLSTTLTNPVFHTLVITDGLITAFN